VDGFYSENAMRKTRAKARCILDKKAKLKDASKSKNIAEASGDVVIRLICDGLSLDTVCDRASDHRGRVSDPSPPPRALRAGASARARPARTPDRARHSTALLAFYEDE